MYEHPYDDFIRELSLDKAREVVYVYEERPTPVEYGPSIDELDLPEGLKEKLKAYGIQRLYKFQWEAYEAIKRGKNVVIMAGTGVGKTEAFILPIIRRIIDEGVKAIIMYPTKALARDQMLRLRKYLDPLGLAVLPYDGDVPSELRSRIYANPPHVLITNPDMVSEALLRVPKFREVLGQYGIIVLDDFHVYCGVFGTHVHYVLRRIARFMRDRQYIVATATVGNPDEFARRLLGVENICLITGPSGRRGVVRHVLVRPLKRGKLAEAVELVALCIRRGMKGLLFADSHKLVELIKKYLDRKGLGDLIRVHRAGLSIEERLEVEEGFREGKYLFLLSTPTLEMGIDIGDIDVAIMATIPPSFSKYLQRSGRVGRRGQLSYVIQILGDDPISTYYYNNPRDFYERRPEDLYIEEKNEEIAKRHCLCMTIEKPVNADRLDPFLKSIFEELRKEGLVELKGRYYVATSRGREMAYSIRGIRGMGDVVRIVHGDRVIGFRELPMALRELHEGAVYLHGGKVYEVYKLDLEGKVAYVKRLPDNYEYYTTALFYSEPMIEEVLEEGRILNTAYQYVRLVIREVVYAYKVKRIGSGEVIETKDLDKPLTYEFKTKGVVIYAPLLRFNAVEILDLLEKSRAYHAFEHVVIMVGENVIGASPTDLGGVSFPTGHIVIYDTYPGGSGASRMLVRNLERVLRMALEIVRNCKCADGCPKCVYSPYCGNDNRYLSRKGAARVIEAILNGTPGEIRELPLESRPLA